jgi:hypothetical protein
MKTIFSDYYRARTLLDTIRKTLNKLLYNSLHYKLTHAKVEKRSENAHSLSTET